MSKIHINANGEPSKCNAEQGRCPFGGESGSDNHFDSKEEAYKYIESEYEKLTTLNKDMINANKELDLNHSWDNTYDAKQVNNEAIKDNSIKINQYSKAIRDNWAHQHPFRNFQIKSALFLRDALDTLHLQKSYQNGENERFNNIASELTYPKLNNRLKKVGLPGYRSIKEMENSLRANGI